MSPALFSGHQIPWKSFSAEAPPLTLLRGLKTPQTPHRLPRPVALVRRR